MIAGFFTVFIAFAVRYAYGLLLPEMIPALAISKTQAGTSSLTPSSHPYSVYWQTDIMHVSSSPFLWPYWA
jgi:hypothetical protein